MRSVQPTVNNPVPQLTAPGDSQAVTNKRKASEPTMEEQEPKRVRQDDETTNSSLKRMAVSGAEVALRLVLNEALQSNTVFGLPLTQEKINQQLTEATCATVSRSVVEGFENQPHLTMKHWAFEWGSIQALLHLVNTEIRSTGVPLGLQLLGGPVTDPSAAEAVYESMHTKHTIALKIFAHEEQKRAQQLGNPNAVAMTPAATLDILGSAVRRPNLSPQPAVPRVLSNGLPTGVLTLANSSKPLPTLEEVNNARMASRNHQGPAQRPSVAVQAFQPPAGAVNKVSAGDESNILAPRHQANDLNSLPADNTRPDQAYQYMPMQSTPAAPTPGPHQTQKNKPIQPATAAPQASNLVSVGPPMQNFPAAAREGNANPVGTPERSSQLSQNQQPSAPANNTATPGSPHFYFRFDTKEWWMIPSAPGQQPHHKVGARLESEANLRVLLHFLQHCSERKAQIPRNFTFCVWLSSDENWRFMQEASRLPAERFPKVQGMEL
ncbi:hypothetical protein QBC40DRAFT_270453 [Triangularia verruculosa]|uniref:Uncharacterized protein n=1 Tax=Triangularia verruculosa TaxID=2587418 RepID=A0AAN7AY10_9PEZI|nr:hypothetical protein QBC40DRAFT_270453 [Triangularia verruculosa]